VKTTEVSGVRVSALGVGTASFGKHCDASAAASTVRAALDCGISFFDTADSYGAGRNGTAERILGRALGRARSDVVIATKFGTEFAGMPASARPERVRSALEGSLRRLGTDYVDLYLLHVPDETTPLADTLGAMADLVRAGKVRAIGGCNLSADQLAAAGAAATDIGFTWVQDEYSVLVRQPEQELFPYLSSRGLGFIAYAPLAQGLLTGKYVDDSLDWAIPPHSRLGRMSEEKVNALLTDRNRRIVASFIRSCRSFGLSPMQVALAWVLSNPTVTSIIPGATSAEQVRNNATAVTLRLDCSIRAEIESSLARAMLGADTR
jgi:aryl-alcohol dehydrogenase-like predicted oxidoreductase